jgi:hypothetical protein
LRYIRREVEVRNTSAFSGVRASVAKAATRFLARPLFYGAVVSCVVGLGLGLWLRPNLRQAHDPHPARTAQLGGRSRAAQLADPEPAEVYGRAQTQPELDQPQPDAAAEPDRAPAHAGELADGIIVILPPDDDDAGRLAQLPPSQWGASSPADESGEAEPAEQD